MFHVFFIGLCFLVLIYFRKRFIVRIRMPISLNIVDGTLLGARLSCPSMLVQQESKHQCRFIFCNIRISKRGAQHIVVTTTCWGRCISLERHHALPTSVRIYRCCPWGLLGIFVLFVNAVTCCTYIHIELTSDVSQQKTFFAADPDLVDVVVGAHVVI